MSHWKEILVALIGAVATVLAAFVTAKKAADDTVTKRIAELSVASGGNIASNGTVISHMGQPFTVTRQAGSYRINFSAPFSAPPIVVALSDGGTKGARAELVAVDTTGFTVEGRDYAANGQANLGFHFIVVRPR
jgi:hypothetical protein